MQQRHRIFLQVQLQVIIVGVVVKDVAGDAAGFGFNSCVGQIGRGSATTCHRYDVYV